MGLRCQHGTGGGVLLSATPCTCCLWTERGPGTLLMLLKPRGWELQTGLCKSAGVNSHALPTSRPRQALVEASAWISCCKVNIGSAPKSPEYMSVKRAGPAGRPHLEGSGHPACSGVGSSEPQGASMTPSTHGSKLYTLPHMHCPAWSSAALGSDVDSPALCDP